jgi:dTDP-4-dehydrorhamnose 3,5-epimerase
MIEVIRTPIDGLLRLRPRVFADPRGHFLETFNISAFAATAGITATFVQDNESRSHAGVLRGLHLQAPPHGQAKLVRVPAGAVLDICVDLRPDSRTFGEHFSTRLDAVDHEMLYVPEGMAHGFLALEDNTVFAYKCSAYYAPQAERTILWNDPDLKIDWGIKDPVISDKDLTGSRFADRLWEK